MDRFFARQARENPDVSLGRREAGARQQMTSVVCSQNSGMRRTGQQCRNQPGEAKCKCESAEHDVLSISTLGRVAINIAAVVADLFTQGAPLIRAHALTLLPALLVTLLAARLLIAFKLLAALLLALGAAFLNIAPAARPALTCRPTLVRLRPSRLRGSKQTQTDNVSEAIHDDQLTAALLGS